jgi:L-threonine kinase
MRVAVPGTCGELVQGTLEGVPCLVSCPIASYSVAEVHCGLGSGWSLQPDLVKTRTALRYGLEYLDLADSGGRVHLDSGLPHGRGYGSSTADIGAALFALGRATGRVLRPADVAQLALRVEPTDGSLFPGWVLWDHRGGQICEELGAPPLLSVIVLDPGGEVDTVAYNQQGHEPILRALAAQHREAFALLQAGIKHGDAATIGAAATLSAVAHQDILPNPLLDLSLRLAQDMGAVGVCRAHSGTIIGLLIDPHDTDMSYACGLARQRCPESVNVYGLSVIGGGPRLLTFETV